MSLHTHTYCRAHLQCTTGNESEIEGQRNVPRDGDHSFSKLRVWRLELDEIFTVFLSFHFFVVKASERHSSCCRVAGYV